MKIILLVVASLGACDLRIKKWEELDNKFALIDKSTGQTIYPSSGSHLTTIQF